MENMTMRQLRLARELTIEDMAKACNVHPNTYAAWERDPGKVRVGAALEIARALGTSVDDIFFSQRATKRSI